MKRQCDGPCIITESRISIVKTNDKGKLRGIADITLNDSFVVCGLRIMDGANGLFVAYPNDPYYTGSDYKLLAFPTSSRLRSAISASLLQDYRRMTQPEET